MNGYPTKVLFATDGTQDSTRAASVAVALSASTGAELHMVHVGQAAASTAGAFAARPPLPGEPPGHAERRTRRLLDRQVEEVRSSGFVVTDGHLAMGDPTAEVIVLAAQLEVDLLVVGSGGP